MTQAPHTNELAPEGASSVSNEPDTMLSRMKDPTRWKKSFKDVVIWFMFGFVLSTLASTFSPGRPIVVGTNSIPAGIYWLDVRVTSFKVGDYFSFPFKPSQAWLRERYGVDRVFTKEVKGVAGDTVYSDADQNLKICHPDPLGGAPLCEAIGAAQKVDSAGRKLTAWVPANHQYTLREGELWAYGSNPRSLDSRYYGPIRSIIAQGKATPLFTWK
ncbi:S26 family signal peptidase [Paraburkholderia sp. A3RO-2L]|jgi:type IV secretory pathway protease TraF|uniref:S26 family signal peptidase n=1 Tax=unclassified Paraburkholderia TaxID=2615204 RepID=UPI0032F92BEA|nr:S26 family signal peptidase [Burkholderia vietnamiensis]